jgi:hypothetical protein
MQENKLQSGHRQRNSVTRTALFDAARLFDHLRRALTVVVGTRNSRPGDEETRCERRSNDHRNASAVAEIEFCETFLGQQCVGDGYQEIVEVEPFEKARDQARAVDTRSNGCDLGCGLQFLQGANPASAVQLVELRRYVFRSLVVQQVEIVDRERVNLRQSQTLQAVLIGAEYAIVCVVETQIEGKGAFPLGGPFQVSTAVEDAPDLGGDNGIPYQGAVSKRRMPAS